MNFINLVVSLILFTIFYFSLLLFLFSRLGKKITLSLSLSFTHQLLNQRDQARSFSLVPPLRCCERQLMGRATVVVGLNWARLNSSTVAVENTVQPEV